MDLKKLILNTKTQINESDLDLYLKDWFNSVVIDETKQVNGYDWSGQFKEFENKKIEYYVITTDKDEDYRIIFNKKLNKYGLESRGIVTSTDEFNGKFIQSVIYWNEDPVKVIKWM